MTEGRLLLKYMTDIPAFLVRAAGAVNPKGPWREGARLQEETLSCRKSELRTARESCLGISCVASLNGVGFEAKIYVQQLIR